MVYSDMSIIYDEIMGSIGEMIKILRKERKLSQEQLGRLAQEGRGKALNKETINRIEHGCNTTIDTLEAIAKVFDLKLGDLIPQNDKGTAIDSSIKERPICPDNDPDHIAYHVILENALHRGNARIERIIMRMFAILEDEIDAKDDASSSRASSEGTRRSGPTKATEEGGRTARKDISSR